MFPIYWIESLCREEHQTPAQRLKEWVNSFLTLDLKFDKSLRLFWTNFTYFPSENLSLPCCWDFHCPELLTSYESHCNIIIPGAEPGLVGHPSPPWNMEIIIFLLFANTSRIGYLERGRVRSPLEISNPRCSSRKSLSRKSENSNI